MRIGASHIRPEFRLKRRILIADENRIFARRLSDLMFDSGYDVRVSVDMGQVKDLIKSWSPDILLVDFFLPQTNVLGLLRFVQNQEEPRRPRVIVMSKQNHVEGIEQIRRAGARDYLVKPFSLEQALEAVKKCLAPSLPPQPPPRLESEAKAAVILRELHLLNLFLKQATIGENAEATLYNLMRMINLKVGGLRSSIIHCLNGDTALILAANDDRGIRGLPLSLDRYPEIAHVMRERASLLIPNVENCDWLSSSVQARIARAGFQTLALFPLCKPESGPFGVLSLRMPLKSPIELFYIEKFGEVCAQIISLLIGTLNC